MRKFPVPWTVEQIGGDVVFSGEAADRIFASLDRKTAEAIAASHGTPVYLICEPALRGRIRAMRRATSAYANVQIAWSLKTNPLKGILEIMRSEGLWVEVVSDYEYELARAAGIHDREIVFNGPARSDVALVSALRGGAIVNLDHEEEIERLIGLGDRVGTSAVVGLRINTEEQRRFGFSLAQGEVHRAVRRLAGATYLHLGGLHNQLGADIRDLDRFRALGRCFAELSTQLGAPLDWIDVGGGLAGTNPGRDMPPAHLPWLAPEAYCDAVLGPLIGSARMFILEPGRTLIEPTGGFLTRVVGVRATPQGERAYVMDGGINAVPSASSRQHPTRALVDEPATDRASLYGPLCMGHDKLAEGIELPRLKRGDLVLMEGVGAYDIPSAISFIEPRPGVLAWRGGEDVCWLRRPETRAHIQALEPNP